MVWSVFKNEAHDEMRTFALLRCVLKSQSVIMHLIWSGLLLSLIFAIGYLECQALQTSVTFVVLYVMPIWPVVEYPPKELLLCRKSDGHFMGTAKRF